MDGEKENYDSVFLADGSESRQKMLEQEEELLDRWLAELYRPETTSAEQSLFDMAKNGIPIGKNVRIKAGIRNLNDGPDMANIDARPKPAVEVGISVSF